MSSLYRGMVDADRRQVDVAVRRNRVQTLWWPAERPHWVVSAVTLHGVLWGLWMGFLTGAAAGTAVFPLWGSLVGALYGLVGSVVPLVPGAFAVAIVALRHRGRADPRAFHTAISRLAKWIFGLLAVAGLAALAVFLVVALTKDSGDDTGGWVGLWLLLGVGPFTVAAWTLHSLLRRAALSLTLTFARRTGWRPETEREVAH